MSGFNQTLATALLGASETVAAIATHGLAFASAYEGIANLVDQRLERRCILTNPEKMTDADRTKALHALEMFGDLGWKVRFSPLKPTYGCVIVDNREAILSPLGAAHGASADMTTFHLTSSSPLLQSISEHFEQLWAGATVFHRRYDGALISGGESSSSTCYYERLLNTSIPAQTENIIIASNEFWDRQIRYFADHPQHLRNADPRHFEELVAELLSRNGLDVELTPESGDGGRDVLAWANTIAGRHLYLVECKRYAENRPVGVQIVRALYGVVQAENATAGLVVTTSDFTRGAISFQQTIRHRMDLKGYDGLVKWLRQTT